MLIRSERITPPGVEPITMAEAKTHLRVDHDDEDVYIASLIAVARDEAEAVCGRRFGEQVWRLYFDRFEAIRLHGCGVVATATLDWRNDQGGWVALSGAEYEVVKAVPAYVFYKDDFNVPTTGDFAEVVRMNVSCGEPAPPGVKAWMLLRIGTLYANREADAERRVEPQQFVPNLLAAHRVMDFS